LKWRELAREIPECAWR